MSARIHILAMLVAIGIVSSTAAAPPAPKQADAKQRTLAVTIGGTATRPDDRPIAGATVYVLADDEADNSSKCFATAQTDARGKYEFRDCALPAYKATGEQFTNFQVAATAPGFGFTWCPEAWASIPVGADGRPVGPVKITTFPTATPATMTALDLRFTGPPAALHGRVTTADGQPIRGAVRVDRVERLQPRPKSLGISWLRMVGGLPEAAIVCRAGPDGQFRLEGLPPGVVCQLLVEHRDYPDTELSAATTDRPPDREVLEAFADQVRPSVNDNPVLVAPLSVRLRKAGVAVVQIVDDSTGAGVAGASVAADGVGSFRTRSLEVTGVDGRAELQLPVGRYELSVKAPRGSDYLRSYGELSATENSGGQPHVVRLKRGSVAEFEVRDADSHAAISGIDFDQEMRRLFGGSRGPLIDLAELDALKSTGQDGRCRVVLQPGKYRFWVRNAEYEVVRSPEGDVDLPAGKTVPVRFELRKKK